MRLTSIDNSYYSDDKKVIELKKKLIACHQKMQQHEAVFVLSSNKILFLYSQLNVNAVVNSTRCVFLIVRQIHYVMHDVHVALLE